MGRIPHVDLGMPIDCADGRERRLRLVDFGRRMFIVCDEAELPAGGNTDYEIPLARVRIIADGTRLREEAEGA